MSERNHSGMGSNKTTVIDRPKDRQVNKRILSDVKICLLLNASYVNREILPFSQTSNQYQVCSGFVCALN